MMVTEQTRVIGVLVKFGKKKLNYYGKQNVKRTIIDRFNSAEERDLKEKFWIAFYIDKYKDIIDDRGYSICVNDADGGGAGGDLCKYKTPEEKAIITQKKVDGWYNKPSEERERINKKKGRKGEENGRYGTHCTDVHKKYLRDAHSGLQAYSKDGKCVFTKDEREIETLLSLGWTRGNCNFCNVGEKNGMYGKHFSDESKQKMRDSMPDMSGDNSPVFNKSVYGKVAMIDPVSFEIVRTFETPARAADYIATLFGLKIYKSSAIISACTNKKSKKNKNRLNHGYIWRFVEDMDDISVKNS